MEEEKEQIFTLTDENKRFIISFLGAVGEMDAMKNIIRGKKLPRSVPQFIICRTAKKRPDLVLSGYDFAKDKGSEYFKYLLQNKDIQKMFMRK
ncbi:MAG: hypothetical protein ACOC7O_02720 [Thermoplasmatota archaeon]